MYRVSFQRQFSGLVELFAPARKVAPNLRLMRLMLTSPLDPYTVTPPK
jgi:hypothetical protein